VNTKNAADLIIVGRGGGSIEDLWSFNEEIVARAIYDSKIPVISGVGHEPDFTIADFVADLRAATPSNAAELAVPDISELYIRLGEYEGNLRRMISTKLSMLSQRLKLLSEKKVFSSPLSYIDERRLYLDYITRRLASAGIKILNEQEKRFAYAAARLDSMSPLKVLGRGYSIAVKADRKAVRSSKELKIGEKLNIKFASGDALCEVKEIQ
jgi:exodeoxyribonuclease VII large subunit